MSTSQTHHFTISNRSASRLPTTIPKLLLQSLQEHVRNRLNNGLRTRISAEEHCEQRTSSVYSIAHCKGLSGHTPFILHFYQKHADIWHDTRMTAWPIEKQSSVALVTKHWHSLSRCREFFFLFCFYKSAFLRLSVQLRMRQKNTARRGGFGVDYHAQITWIVTDNNRESEEVSLFGCSVTKNTTTGSSFSCHYGSKCPV